MAHRLDPPRVDPGGKPRVGFEMRIERRLVDDLAARDIDEDRIVFHQRQLGCPDQSFGGLGQCGADHENVGGAQQFVEPFGRGDPIGRLVAGAAPVDRVDLHAKGAHQPRRRNADRAKAEDAANPAPQHAVRVALVKLAAFQFGVLGKKAFGRGQCQRHDVLGHRLGRGALVAGDRQLRRQVAGRDPIDPGGAELQEPRVADERRLAGA